MLELQLSFILFSNPYSCWCEKQCASQSFLQGMKVSSPLGRQMSSSLSYWFSHFFVQNLRRQRKACFQALDYVYKICDAIYRKVVWKKHSFRNLKNRIMLQALPFTSRVTLRKITELCWVSIFSSAKWKEYLPRLTHSFITRIKWDGLCQNTSKLTSVKSSEGCLVHGKHDVSVSYNTNIIL